MKIEHFTKGQTRAYESIASGRNTLILGTAGSGKSTLIGVIREHFGYKTIFCGTTGISNQLLFNAEGGHGTAHKVFSLPNCLHNANHIKNITPYTRKLFTENDTVQCVNLDEVGMLTPDQFVLMAERVKRFSKPTKKRAARNIQMVLVGDLLQLPCVLFGKELELTLQRHGTRHFFLTKEFKEMNFEVVYLDKAVRSGDPEFNSFLDAIRYNDESRMKEALAYFNKRANLPLPENVPLITTSNAAASDGNRVALSYNKNPCGVYRPTITGNYDMKNCPVEEELRLKVGMPVLTLVNHPDKLYNNGSGGIVEDMTEDGVYVRFNVTKETHLVEPFVFEEKDTYVDGVETLEDGTERPLILQKVVGSAECIPLRLASALTCHKVQGKTIDSPFVIDLGFRGFGKSGFGESIAYTALSRATDVDKIFLKHPLTRAHVKACPITLQWLKDNNACGDYFNKS